MTTTQEFDAFVLARWDALLTTANQLTSDQGGAEELLQTALTKVWFSWDKVSGDPEPYVRRVIANTHASWWRRRWFERH